MKAMEFADYWELPVTGEIVGRCCVDEAFVLEIGQNKRRFVLRIEADFSLAVGGKSVACVPANRESLGPALLLFGRSIVSCRAAKNGALDIVFTEGAALHVGVDHRYEAWELAAETGGLRVVCSAGGLLSIWQPKSS